MNTDYESYGVLEKEFNLFVIKWYPELDILIRRQNKKKRNSIIRKFQKR